MANKENIIRAAGHYLCAENPEDLYREYLKLLSASNKGEDDKLAADFAEVWEPLSMSMTVAKLIQVIEDDAADQPEFPDVLKNINWSDLRGQKTVLLKLIDVIEKTTPQPGKIEGSEMVAVLIPKEMVEALDGIIGLMDNLQDFAVDVMGYPEMEVFEFEDEENREPRSVKPSVKTVHVCGNCGSDNVEMKGWIKPNKGTSAEFESVSEDEEDNYCNDCGEHCQIIVQTIPAYKEVVGFQVVSIDGDDIHPDMVASFCVYSLKQAEKMLTDSSKWKLLTLWTDDVEEPEMMFEGDPRE